MPAEVIDLADQVSAMEDVGYRKLQGLHDSVQKGNTIKLPKTTAVFSYSSGAGPELPFLRKENRVSDVFGDEDEFGSENSDDFDLPSPSKLLKERFEVVSPASKPVFKSAKSLNSQRFKNSDAGIESGTLGLQEPITTYGRPEAETAPKATQSFEDDCFDFGSFDENDYDYPIQAPVMSSKAIVGPEMHVGALGEINAGPSKKRDAPEMADETPATKYRRTTRDYKAVPESPSLIVDSQTLIPVDGEQIPMAVDEEEEEWVTFTYGGEVVRKRKRKGNQDIPLPAWVMTDMSPEFYEEYGDCVDFV